MVRHIKYLLQTYGIHILLIWRHYKKNMNTIRLMQHNSSTTQNDFHATLYLIKVLKIFLLPSASIECLILPLLFFGWRNIWFLEITILITFLSITYLQKWWFSIRLTWVAHCYRYQNSVVEIISVKPFPDRYHKLTSPRAKSSVGIMKKE